MPWPISLLKSLENWIRNFVWSGDIHTRKIVTVAWSKVCCPMQEGGLGLRSIRSINDAAMLQLSWDLIASEINGQVSCELGFFKIQNQLLDM